MRHCKEDRSFIAKHGTRLVATLSIGCGWFIGCGRETSGVPESPQQIQRTPDLVIVRQLSAEDIAKLKLGMGCQKVIDILGPTLSESPVLSYPSVDGGHYFLLFHDFDDDTHQSLQSLRAVLKCKGPDRSLDEAIYVLPISKSGRRLLEDSTRSNRNKENDGTKTGLE